MNSVCEETVELMNKSLKQMEIPNDLEWT